MGARKRKLDGGDSRVVRVDMARFQEDATQHSDPSSFWHSPEDPYFLPSEPEEELGNLVPNQEEKKGRSAPENSAPGPSNAARNKAKVTSVRTSPRSKASPSKSARQRKTADNEGTNNSLLTAEEQKTGKARGIEPLVERKSAGPKQDPPKPASTVTLRTFPGIKTGAQNTELQKLAKVDEVPTAVVIKSGAQDNLAGYKSDECEPQLRKSGQQKMKKLQPLPSDRESRPPTQDIAMQSSPMISGEAKPKNRVLVQSKLGFSRKGLGASLKIQPAENPPTKSFEIQTVATREEEPAAQLLTCSPRLSEALDEIDKTLPGHKATFSPAAHHTSGPSSIQSSLHGPKQSHHNRVQARGAKQPRMQPSRLNPAVSRAAAVTSPEAHVTSVKEVLPAQQPMHATKASQQTEKGPKQTRKEILSMSNKETTASELGKGSVKASKAKAEVAPQKRQPLEAEGLKEGQQSHIVASSPAEVKRPAAASKVSRNAPQGIVKKQAHGLGTPLLLRRGFHMGLSKALLGSSFHNPAPAVTVMEAQESGEQRLVQDNMLYALDGLCSSSSSATHCQAAGSLLDISATKRGRQALRCDGVLQEAMSTARAILSKQWDSKLALIFATMLHAFLTDPANLAAVSCKDGVNLLACLIMGGRTAKPPDSTEEDGLVHSAATRLISVLQSSKVLPDQYQDYLLAPLVALVSLVGAIDPQQSSLASEAFKNAIREYGLLQLLAQTAVAQGSCDSEPWLLWRMRTILMAIENCTFACTESENFLVKLRIQSGSTASSFISRLVSKMKMLAEQLGTTENSKQSLHCALSVAMNLTHHSDNGCQQVVNAGGLDVASELLARLTPRGHKESCELISGDLELLNVTLGLLINIADSCIQSLHPLVCHRGPTQPNLLLSLCSIFQGSAVQLSSSEEETSRSDSIEMTEADLSSHEDDSAKSIIEVYAALLIGFLAISKEELWKAAEEGLVTTSLAHVLAKVKQCLEFYTTAGAITEKTEQSLRRLVSAMQAKLG